MDVQVVSVYSYIESTTDYCIMRLAVNSHALYYLFIRKLESPHYYASLKLLFLYNSSTVLPAKSDSDFMLCLQSYQGLIMTRSLVYLSHPQDRINTQVIYRLALVQVK